MTIKQIYLDRGGMLTAYRPETGPSSVETMEDELDQLYHVSQAIQDGASHSAMPYVVDMTVDEDKLDKALTFAIRRIEPQLATLWELRNEGGPVSVVKVSGGRTKTINRHDSALDEHTEDAYTDVRTSNDWQTPAEARTVEPTRKETDDRAQRKRTDNIGQRTETVTTERETPELTETELSAEEETARVLRFEAAAFNLLWQALHEAIMIAHTVTMWEA